MLKRHCEKRIEEERRRAEEERLAKEKRLAEEKRIKDLGPNFPKVWDLSYKKEDTLRIFLRRDDNLDWDFFKFKVYVNKTDFFKQIFMKTWTNLSGRILKELRTSGRVSLILMRTFLTLLQQCMF